MPTLRTGDTGPLVLRLQYLLSYWKFLNAGDVDGVFGNATEDAVRSFQADQGLKADGVAGERTWLALSTGIEIPPTLSLGCMGESVARLQRALNDLRDLGFSPAPPLETDGIFGPRTEQMVAAWQAFEALPVDGIAGPRTWASSVHAAGATLATFMGPAVPQDGPPPGWGSSTGAAPAAPPAPRPGMSPAAIRAHHRPRLTVSSRDRFPAVASLAASFRPIFPRIRPRDGHRNQPSMTSWSAGRSQRWFSLVGCCLTRPIGCNSARSNESRCV